MGTQLEMEYESDAVDLIAELTYKKLISYGSDLEAFERLKGQTKRSLNSMIFAFLRHAKRATINADDVKLLVRRNNSLVSIRKRHFSYYEYLWVGLSDIPTRNDFSHL